MSGVSSQRRTVYYSGRVQGVGFRYSCRSISRGHQVSGFVRNLADGRVELVVEGEARALDDFLAEITDMNGVNIHEAEVNRGTPSGEFDDFTIRTK